MQLIDEEDINDTDTSRYSRVEIATGHPVSSALTPVVQNWTRIVNTPEGYAASYLGAAHSLLDRGVETTVCTITILKKGPTEPSQKTIEAAVLIGGFVLIANTIKPITDLNRPYINKRVETAMSTVPGELIIGVVFSDVVLTAISALKHVPTNLLRKPIIRFLLLQKQLGSPVVEALGSQVLLLARDVGIKSYHIMSQLLTSGCGALIYKNVFTEAYKFKKLYDELRKKKR